MHKYESCAEGGDMLYSYSHYDYCDSVIYCDSSLHGSMLNQNHWHVLRVIIFTVDYPPPTTTPPTHISYCQ